MMKKSPAHNKRYSKCGFSCSLKHLKSLVLYKSVWVAQKRIDSANIKFSGHDAPAVPQQRVRLGLHPADRLPVRKVLHHAFDERLRYVAGADRPADRVDAHRLDRSR